MTDEEKARELAIKATRTINDNREEVYNAFCEAALQEMVQRKKEQMIEKAVEWLKNKAANYVVCDESEYNHYASKTLIEDFKKAMMEE